MHRAYVRIRAPCTNQRRALIYISQRNEDCVLVKSIREAKLTKFFFLLLLLQIQRQEFIIRIRNKRVNGAIFLNCYKKKEKNRYREI